MKNKYSTNYI